MENVALRWVGSGNSTWVRLELESVQNELQIFENWLTEKLKVKLQKI